MYKPPTLAEINAQIIADIESEIGQSTPILRRAFIRVFARALAGVLAGIYRRNLWAYYQIFPQTADLETIAYYEDRYGITPSPAVAAILAVTISGDDGSTSPAGTLWTSDDSGAVYSQLLAATISGVTASAQLECLTPGGASNLAPASTISPVSPLDGIASAAVASTVTEGQDADTLDERRAQVLARMRRTDEIGTLGYYVSTALEVPGVALAHVKRNASGDILVYPLAEIAGTARAPSAALIAAVQAYMSHELRRPLAASLSALTVTERTATVTITGISPNDEATKANIVSAIAAYFYAAYPRQYSDDVDTTDIISLGSLWAIVVANGATATGVTLAISGIGSGIPSYQLPVGEIIAGSVVWA